MVASELGRLMGGVPGARWERPEQMHLTLRFIGEVERPLFEDVLASLGEVEASAFELVLHSVGHFPPRGEPRVLWAGVRACPPLLDLQRRIERALVRGGLPPEPRAFAPHVTLARLRASPREKLEWFLKAQALVSPAPFPIEAFHLYSSRLSREGSLYRIEASYPLRGGYDFEALWDEPESA
jgi:2'-5' RNA ligase